MRVLRGLGLSLLRIVGCGYGRVWGNQVCLTLLLIFRMVLGLLFCG